MFQEDGTIKVKQDASHLMQLPVEMILSISEYLSDLDLACFALSCKPLFAIMQDLTWFRSKMARMGNSRVEKALFLSRLEQSVPWLVYCPVLGRLSPFDKDGKVDRRLKPAHEIYNLVKRMPSYYWYQSNEVFYHSEAITYEQTRLMRNHVLFGPRHGIAPSALSYEKRIQEKKVALAGQQCQMRSEDSRTFRWIDGELFLSRTSTISLEGLEYRKARFSALLNLLRQERSILCYHCIPDRWSALRFGGDCISEDVRENRANNLDSSPGHSFGFCKFCDTDWNISISTPGSTGLVAVFTTWHNLGGCSFPLDPKWKRISTPLWYQILGRPARKKGDIMRKWMEAKTESSSSLGGCSISQPSTVPPTSLLSSGSAVEMCSGKLSYRLR
ncbi:hypothetical protein F5Y09DRAFT_336944 [Xylaria sp. FL1042]|nr:hypothetical protein F5Y09DRAFT_336944 [Xylaria sp. FL1042]